MLWSEKLKEECRFKVAIYFFLTTKKAMKSYRGKECEEYFGVVHSLEMVRGGVDPNPNFNDRK